MKTKASLSFAVFGISFTLAVADQVERDIVKLYANPKPARQRGKDGRFVSAGVAV